jgi:hypothetical protein
MKPVDQAIREKVSLRKQELMKLSPAELRQLPPYAAEQFSACGKAQLLSVYHDRASSGGDLFVTQCKRKILFGYGHMFAEGFVLDSSDNISEAEKELMWDYT